MKKQLILTILFILSIPIILSADFIIPENDPVYSLLENLYIENQIDHSYTIYPQYHNEIIGTLKNVSKTNLLPQYYDLTKYHLNRLESKYSNGIEYSFLPLNKIPKTVKYVFDKDSTNRRLLSYKNGELKLFLSAILGLNYDVQNNSSDLWRRFDYYGLEFGGNVKPNFGFYTSYRKGHYKGDTQFILNDHLIHRSGGMYRKVITVSELDFKNEYLNLAVGYGNFAIGNSITSSIILNSEVNPFGYLKYYHKYKNFYFMGFNAQLFPDSTSSTEEDYQQKSFALQTFNYSTKNFKFGFGQGVIYGDKSIDFAYLTPLMVYKLIDFKNHNRDNQVVFSYFTARPFKSTLIYGSFFMDDLKKERLKTKYALSALAFQLGTKYQLINIPLQFSLESTVIGPANYGHSPQYGVETRYTHDNSTLGYEYGANLINNAISIKYNSIYFDVKLLYENLQQGNLGYDPFVWEGNDVEFLGEQMSRSQFFTTELEIHPGFHFNIRFKYRLEYKAGETNNYFYSGMEFKY